MSHLVRGIKNVCEHKQISVCDYLIDEYLANQIVKVDKGSRKKHRGNTLYMQVYVYYFNKLLVGS